jgi:HD-GYP domain-containing protein (c-di-GMP phosphodiesterase class II)
MLESQILAVADVVEAMSSHRPYRPAHSLDITLDEISKNKGKLYEPDVVDSCLWLITGKGFKFN